MFGDQCGTMFLKKSKACRCGTLGNTVFRDDIADTVEDLAIFFALRQDQIIPVGALLVIQSAEPVIMASGYYCRVDHLFQRFHTEQAGAYSYDLNNLPELEQEALAAVQSRKWVKGSADREALIGIYDRLFANIEGQMRWEGANGACVSYCWKARRRYPGISRIGCAKQTSV